MRHKLVGNLTARAPAFVVREFAPRLQRAWSREFRKCFPTVAAFGSERSGSAGACFVDSWERREAGKVTERAPADQRESRRSRG